jgi:hypothetical protein
LEVMQNPLSPRERVRVRGRGRKESTGPLKPNSSLNPSLRGTLFKWTKPSHSLI